jgi:hypothetical protein
MCLVTGEPIADPDHVRTRGAGGGDELPNLRPLSRVWHDRRHAGLLTFDVDVWNARLP